MKKMKKIWISSKFIVLKHVIQNKYGQTFILREFLTPREFYTSREHIYSFYAVSKLNSNTQLKNPRKMVFVSEKFA